MKSWGQPGIWVGYNPGFSISTSTTAALYFFLSLCIGGSNVKSYAVSKDLKSSGFKKRKLLVD